MTIQGTNLANTTATASWNKAVPLATSLGGVSVTIGGVPTYVNYISPTQVNVLTPPVPAKRKTNVDTSVNYLSWPKSGSGGRNNASIDLLRTGVPRKPKGASLVYAELW